MVGDSDSLNCALSGVCGGCPWAERDFGQHLRDKTASVRARYPTIASVNYSPRGQVRDRADLVWEKAADGSMRLGLYGMNDRNVVNLETCPMMSLPLEEWFQEFRKVAPPIQKGSVRLRVSPAGERGVWIDFSNQDVKRLFEQKDYLLWLSERAFVEIGQRRKALRWQDGRPRLGDPELKPWFETYAADFTPIPLFGPVGGFSQAGFAANREMVRAVADLVEASGTQSWLELFCGNGNFALALAARGHTVEAIELDALALAGLQLSLAAAPANLGLKVERGDVYLKTKTLPSFEGRGLLVDPPRAGLRELLGQLEHGPRPASLVYVSCFSEVFLSDLQRLEDFGYRVDKLVGIDQFPFSDHMEWVGLLKRG